MRQTSVLLAAFSWGPELSDVYLNYRKKRTKSKVGKAVPNTLLKYSAEIFLRNSRGPFSWIFHSMFHLYLKVYLAMKDIPALTLIFPVKINFILYG